MGLDLRRDDDATVAAAPLFRYLLPHFREGLRTVMERRSLCAGEMITSSYGHALFVIEHGAIATEGNRQLRSGAWFGDLFTASPVTARAELDSVVLVLRYDRFCAFLTRHRGLSIHVLAGLARELRAVTAGGARDAL
jgi:CRP-like cAMP-binding protein